MRTKLVTLVLAAVVGTFVAASVAVGAKPTPTAFKLKAALNVGQEKPIPKGTKLGASGRFTATLKGTALTWRLTFRHLSGPAIAAHIHMGKRGKAGNVIVPLCPPRCVSGKSGTTMVKKDVRDAIERGLTYVNVHTAKNPGGEIRGQVKATES